MLFFIELDARGVDVAGVTRKPNGAWVARLAGKRDDWAGGP